MTEVVKHDNGEVQKHDEPSMLAVIAQAAADPRCDVAKMRELIQLQQEVERRQAEVQFNISLSNLMPRLPVIEKNGVILNRDKSVRSRYAYYEDIDAIIRPLLAEEGFSIFFDTKQDGQVMTVTGTLFHRMGHSRESSVTLPMKSEVITGMQLVGATTSYGKRYVVCNMLNIVFKGQDTDGNNPATIDEHQALTIYTMLKDTNSDMAKFYKWAGVTKVEDILAENYQKVISMLESKGRNR